MRRRLVPLAVLLFALVPAAPASAGFVAAEAIDGPHTEDLRLGDLDVARDGSGAVTYLKREGGINHVYVSRLNAGMFLPPERVDAGLDSSASEPVVAVSDGGRVAVSFISAGQAFGTVWAAGATGWTPPQQLASGASFPAIDMSINGAAYVTFSAGGDLRAARLDRGSTTFNVLGQPLDVDANNVAGVDSGRSRVAVSADGTAVAVWAEAGRVYARRLFNGNVSTISIEVNVPQFDGHAGFGGDLPDVDIEDDSSFAWVAMRQVFEDGGKNTTRAIARRLKGSRFEDPVAVDGLSWGGEEVGAPNVEMSGRGEGLVATPLASTGGAAVDLLKDNKFHGGRTIGGAPGVPSLPAGAIAESADRVVAYIQGGSPVSLVARQFDDDLAKRIPPGPGPETPVSLPAFGDVDPVAGMDVAGNRAGDVAMVAVQRNAEGRRLVVATYDRPPGAVTGYTTTGWRGFARPSLSWSGAFELWGPITYRVEIDGVPMGETTDTKLTTLNPVPDGIHQWRVVATDKRGQSVISKSRFLRVDATPPTVEFSAKRSSGRRVAVTAKAGDVLPPSGRASGIKTIKVDWGDGSPVELITKARKASHRYGSGGTKTIRVSATDRAGNAVAVTDTVRPKKK